MNLHNIPAITRRTGRYSGRSAGNVASGCAALVMRVWLRFAMRIAITGLGLAILGLLISVALGAK
jgi:hypothetical protein